MRQRYNGNNSQSQLFAIRMNNGHARLSDLALGQVAKVMKVDERTPADPISARLRDLGFVRGEPVRVVASGPLGGDPLLIQVGFTRFALRRGEADRVLVGVLDDGTVNPAPIASGQETDRDNQSGAAEI